MNTRLIHDASAAMTQALIDMMQPHLPYEMRLKAVGEFYCICKSGLEAYCLQEDRMRQRLKPLEN